LRTAGGPRRFVDLPIASVDVPLGVRPPYFRFMFDHGRLGGPGRGYFSFRSFVGPVARAIDPIDPGQSVKPSDKKGVAPWRRGCFFGVATPNPHARQNSPPGLKSNLQT